ncbi:hypothetical protein CRUP_012844 [Coryphaenoides rupestris]|nr:hypothetical protein CRUP_012844 [Coryphaenoides rupestris]
MWKRNTALEEEEEEEEEEEKGGDSDIVMATKTTATAAVAAACESEASRLGGIDALRLTTPGPVRRNLFGPVDHRQLQQDFQAQLAVGTDLAKWEELRYEEVPAFYRGRTVRTVAAERRCSSPASSSGESSPRSCCSSSGSGDEYLELTTRGRYSVQLAEKRKQSTMTDFFKMKKQKLVPAKGSQRL